MTERQCDRHPHALMGGVECPECAKAKAWQDRSWLPREVVDGMVYQGSAAQAIAICESNGRLTELGLKAVLTVADNIRIRVPANIVHLHLPIDELLPVPKKYFNIACNLGIYPLLVHCQAGANRSRVFAAAIAHKAWDIPLVEAIKLADPPDSGVVFKSMMEWVRGK